MDANLNDAIENVFKQWEGMKLDDAVNQLRVAYEAALEAEKEDSKEFEELFKEWCDNEGGTIWDNPETMHDQMELFFALGRDRRVTPLVMVEHGGEDAVYQFPAGSAKVYVLHYSIDDCMLCEKDLRGESVCPHCGLDNTLNPDQVWVWVKNREGVVSDGE